MKKKIKSWKLIKPKFTLQECNDIIECLEYSIKSNFVHIPDESYMRGIISKIQSEKEYLIQMGVIPR